QVSWIWMAHGVSDDGDLEMHEALQVEWSKSRAWKERWLEEVLIVQEEMW
ncbi:hypothetical protein BS47DRAFT_1309100, partial [Hydnum rufescens UP504]